ncbi:MAG: hypothetical protein KC910_08010 [Candidatus Eremiobacteraeota bacterium]|nr:hypothetical protein [Candidatus Eremiobacteraeota bacterium]
MASVRATSTRASASVSRPRPTGGSKKPAPKPVRATSKDSSRISGQNKTNKPSSSGKSLANGIASWGNAGNASSTNSHSGNAGNVGNASSHNGNAGNAGNAGNQNSNSGNAGNAGNSSNSLADFFQSLLDRQGNAGNAGNAGN